MQLFLYWNAYEICSILYSKYLSYSYKAELSTPFDSKHVSKFDQNDFSFQNFLFSRRAKTISSLAPCWHAQQIHH